MWGNPYPGVQTNEAPVRFLLAQALQDGNPINSIYYLCTEECKKPSILAADITEEYLHSAYAERPFLPEGGIEAYDDAVRKELERLRDKESISTEEYFELSVRLYCALVGYKQPVTLYPIQYDIKDSSASLPELISILEQPAYVDIDITGGGRDAAVLAVLAIQTLILKYEGRSTEFLGNIVFSYFGGDGDPNYIARQNGTFDLVNLVNAVNAFANYGRVDSLKNLFEGISNVSIPVRKLVESMERFADSIALCDVSGIEGKVREVQLHLAAAENDPTVADKESNCSKEEGLQETDAATLQKAAHAELLFRALIPMIQERFIPTEESSSQLTIEIIRWCINHQMVQQALAIFRENMPKAIYELGLFNLNEEASSDVKSHVDMIANPLGTGNTSSSAIDEDIRHYFQDRGMACSFHGAGVLEKLREAFAFRHPNRYASIRNVQVENSCEQALSAVLLWVRYLWLVRNCVMHAGQFDNVYLTKFSKTYGPICGIRCEPGKITLHAIQQDVLSSIAAIEKAASCVSESNSETQEAFGGSWETAWDEMLDTIASEAVSIPLSECRQIEQKAMPLLANAGQDGIRADDVQNLGLPAAPTSAEDVLRILAWNSNEKLELVWIATSLSREVKVPKKKPAANCPGDMDVWEWTKRALEWKYASQKALSICLQDIWTDDFPKRGRYVDYTPDMSDEQFFEEVAKGLNSRFPKDLRCEMHLRLKIEPSAKSEETPKKKRGHQPETEEQKDIANMRRQNEPESEPKSRFAR